MLVGTLIALLKDILISPAGLMDVTVGMGGLSSIVLAASIAANSSYSALTSSKLTPSCWSYLAKSKMSSLSKSARAYNSASASMSPLSKAAAKISAIVTLPRS